MSLLHRWSLPSRGFFRDLSEGEETSNRSRFTATKIGRQSPRRKANIASVFSTLFERPENHRGMKELRHCSDATDNLPLLVCNENVPPDTNYRDSRSHKCHDIALLEETALRRQSSDTRLIPTNSNAGGTTLPAFFIPEPIGEFARQIDEVLNIHSFGLSSIEPISAADPDGFLPLQPISSAGYCQRIRSASSSYPSEGIRSPPPGYRSPDLAPPRTASHFAEYQRYGRYPSQNSWDLTSMPTAEMPINGAIGGKTHAASGGKDASNFRSLPSTDQPKPLSRSTCPDITGPRGEPSAVCAVLKQQKPAPKSGNVVPILENENALPVYLESGFGSYERLPGRSTIDDDDSYGLEYRHMGSMDLLRASVDTDRTMLIAAKRPSPSSDDSVWSTIRPTRKKRLSRPASWMQLFTLASSSRPPSTSTQQVQRLKLLRWAKRTSFKTKARFKLVGRSVRPAKRTGFRARGRRWHRSRRGGDPTKTVNKNCEKQLKKKELKTKTKKGLGNVGKTLEVTRERVKQHRRTADHFFGVLVAKKSLQFGLHRSGKGNKVNRCHERAASCPLDIST